MATPIIGDILNVIRSIVSWIVDVTPRWVKFLFFFSLLIIIGSVIMPIFYNSMGYFCVDNTLYKNPTGDVYTNFKLSNKFLEFDSLEKFEVVEDKCLKVGDSGTLYYQGGGCTNCTELVPFVDDDYMIGRYCKSDAYRYDNVDFAIHSFDRGLFCEDKTDPSWYAVYCMPPIGYYWEFNSTNYTELPDNTINYTNASNIFLNYLLEENIRSTPISEGGELVGVKCFDNSKPKLAVAGVDLFNYQLWLLFIFIGVLFWVYKTWS